MKILFREAGYLGAGLVLGSLLMPPLHAWLVRLAARSVQGPIHVAWLPAYQDFLARLPQPLAIIELLLPWLALMAIRRLAGSRRHDPHRAGLTQQDGIEVVRDLIERGADINQLDGSGHTLLQRAVSRGDRAVVAVLLDNGADLDVPDSETGLSALHIAAKQGDAELCEVLIRYGADPDAVAASGGDTPLHVAAAHGHAATVAVLLKYRARPDRCNTAGQTVLQLAQRHPRVLEVLQQNASQEWPYLKISGG